MQKLSEEQIKERDSKRDLQAEIKQATRELKQGQGVGRVTANSPTARIRINMGLSQAAFAELLGVSKRTIQQWEQLRREPSSAAKTLLRIAEKRPDVLRDELTAA